MRLDLHQNDDQDQLTISSFFFLLHTGDSTWTCITCSASNSRGHEDVWFGSPRAAQARASNCTKRRCSISDQVLSRTPSDPVRISFLYLAVNIAIEWRYHSYAQYLQQAAPPEQVALHQKLLLAVLNAVSAYVSWIPLKYEIAICCALVFDLLISVYSFVFDGEFEGAFCRLLPDLELRIVPSFSRSITSNLTSVQAAVECLLLLLGRKFKPDERQRLFNIFTYTNFLVESLSKSKLFEDDYQFHKRLGQALTLLGTHHLAALKGSTTKFFPPNYDTFLRLILTFGTHPSIMLSSFSLPFWIQLSQDEEVSKQPFIAPFIIELLKMCSAKLFKSGDLKVCN